MNNTHPWETSYPPKLKNYNVDLQGLPRSGDKLLLDAVKDCGDAIAFTVVLPGELRVDLSFEDVDSLSDAFSTYLVEQEKLTYGDVVALQLPNSLNYPIAVLGAWKAGLIVTNVNPFYTENELSAQLVDSGAKLLVACDLFVENAKNVVKNLGISLITTSISDFFEPQVGAIIQEQMNASTHVKIELAIKHARFMDALAIGQDLEFTERSRHPVALYQYTGGTTGQSKGAVITHVNLMAILQMVEDFFKSFEAELVRDDSILTVLPMYHVFAFTLNFMLFFKMGARNVLIPDPRPLSNLKPVFESFNITWMSGVDTLYSGLLSEPWFKDIKHTLKYAIAGGSALRPSTAKRWQSDVCPILEGYGLTETSCIVSVHPPIEPQRPGSVGLPMPGSEIKLVDKNGNEVSPGEEGELAVKGPHIICEYLNRPDESAQSIIDGWLLTGDIATMDEDGYLRIVDRKKDMILVSGFNVYPNEVEAVINNHPDIIEVAVIGVPDVNTGEALRAFVVSRRQNFCVEDLVNYCRKHLTAYKVPKQMVFPKELPKSPVGKILRNELRKIS